MISRNFKFFNPAQQISQNHVPAVYKQFHINERNRSCGNHQCQNEMAKNIQIQQMKGKYAQACAFMMKIQIFIKYTKTMLKNIILG